MKNTKHHSLSHLCLKSILSLFWHSMKCFRLCLSSLSWCLLNQRENIFSMLILFFLFLLKHSWKTWKFSKWSIWLVTLISFIWSIIRRQWSLSGLICWNLRIYLKLSEVSHARHQMEDFTCIWLLRLGYDLFNLSRALKTSSFKLRESKRPSKVRILGLSFM